MSELEPEAETESSAVWSHDFFQSLVSLILVGISTVGAGILLASQVDRLDDFPGLLLMVPAAIALRGNVFGAVGSRLGTAIHSGTYKLSFSPSSVMGENVIASLLLSLVISFILAVFAKGTAVALGISNSISIDRFIAISVLGGLLASLVVMILALWLTSASVRYNWNPDNVTAPLVTAVGDLLTVPALLWSATLMDSDIVPSSLTLIFFAAIVVFGAMVFLSGREAVKTIVVESAPVLLLALYIDLIAGFSIERQREEFLDFPALLILIPSHLAVAGALGGILSSRLSSKLHLGMLQPTPFPRKNAIKDQVSILLLASPAFLLLAGLTILGSNLFDLAGPGAIDIISVTFLGGAMAVIIVISVSYYATILSVRSSVDPDTYAIPLVTAVLDLTSALTLTLSIGILNVF